MYINLINTDNLIRNIIIAIIAIYAICKLVDNMVRQTHQQIIDMHKQNANLYKKQ